MNKKLILGSFLVLALFLLIPTIPAIQSKEIKELSDFPDVKHPLLFVFVVILLEIRAVRALYLFNFASNTETHQDRYDFDHPILGMRAIWLLLTSGLWAGFWQIISHSLGWNWELF